MEKKTQINVWYVLLALLAVLVIQDALIATRQTETLPYSEFKRLVAEGKVGEATIGPTTITGRFREPVDGKPFFVTQRVDQDLAADLAQGGVTFTGAIQSTFLTSVLSWIVPALVFFGLWWFLIRRFADRAGLGGMMSVGRSKAKVYVERDTGTTFGHLEKPLALRASC